MNRITLLLILPFTIGLAFGQSFPTPFEKSKGLESATYAQAIAHFEALANASAKVKLQTMGLTDAGYPLHMVLVSADGVHDPARWKQSGKVVILVNNSIHPGEPDGTDASMLLVRDWVTGKQTLPQQVALAFIPVYNIGGALNRGPYSRVNQNGPAAYGFRGNARNYDLNRDFTKADSRNARGFAQIFHWLDPDILIDNHVSDGADFQHTMTLLTTQYDKLGGGLGNWLRNTFEPSLYAGMKQRGWDMFPYVNFNAYDLNRGMGQFYDPPRYSSGYAALWQTIGFVPETHMLKPFAERVRSTYDLMVTIVQQADRQRDSLLTLRAQLRREVMRQSNFPLSWSPDTTRHTTMTFLGYERDTVTSEVTGLPRMRYDHSRPFAAPFRFFNYFKGEQPTAKPAFYVIPAGWHTVTELLQLNKVSMRKLTRDSLVQATVTYIENYTPATRPYEGHFKHSRVQTRDTLLQVQLLKGDWIIPTGQKADRFLAEMLDPRGDDSYFAWNYFDPILQQKEGYSAYRWEEVAANWLRDNPDVRTRLEAKKHAEPEFARNAQAILQWVYRQSPWFEPAYMRYPVYRIFR